MIELPLWVAKQTDSLEARIEGTPFNRIMTEFLSTSALYPIVDALRVITAEGIIFYLRQPAHYVLFIAAFIQAWVLGRYHRQGWQFVLFGNLITVSLYVFVEMFLEGPTEFFADPYHWVFLSFSLLMALSRGVQVAFEDKFAMLILTTLLTNLIRLSLFPLIYIVIELSPQLDTLTWAVWSSYIHESSHQFLFLAAFFFGALLGLTELYHHADEQLLKATARQLKHYSEWSFSGDLLNDALADPSVLQLRRVEQTIMFMDIRGFTAWTERSDPQEVVEILNQYYDLANQVIDSHHGHKPHFTADEVMSWFESPHEAIATAIALQEKLPALLQPYQLGVGIGLNTGEVIAGVMGSHNTRKYDIIGDAVNSAKRLESAAGPGELLVAEKTYHYIKAQVGSLPSRTIQAKGKSEDLTVYSLVPSSL